MSGSRRKDGKVKLSLDDICCDQYAVTNKNMILFLFEILCNSDSVYYSDIVRATFISICKKVFLELFDVLV